MERFKEFLNLKKFLIFWGSQTVSSFGTAMTAYAMIIWTYQQQGTASSITWLAVCYYLPSILFCSLAGVIADRWDKKKIILLSDSVAALGTVSILILYTLGSLAVWHLYIINTLLSLMNAFQHPAAYVTETLLIPKEQYVRASGLQSFSNSLVTILTPALATAILAFGGVQTVLIVDLFSFAVAFLILLVFITIPPVDRPMVKSEDSVFHGFLVGLGFFRQHRALLRIIVFFSCMNLLASLAGNSILPAMVLARTGGNQTVLGLVTSAIGLGSLAGSILVTLLKPAKHRTRVVFLTCAFSFLLCDVLWGVGKTAEIWIFAAFTGNLPLPFLNANLTTIMRIQVPLDLQGRVFATRDTLQFITIPIGLFLGGALADTIFEPFMMAASPVQWMLSMVVGSGKGSGLAVMFLFSGIIGCVASLVCLGNRDIRLLDSPEK